MNNVEQTLDLNQLDAEPVKAPTDSNSENSSIMSEEFPLYQNRMFVLEENTSNSDVHEFVEMISFDVEISWCP